MFTDYMTERERLAQIQANKQLPDSRAVCKLLKTHGPELLAPLPTPGNCGCETCLAYQRSFH